jgi:hypothetical protein
MHRSGRALSLLRATTRNPAIGAPAPAAAAIPARHRQYSAAPPPPGAPSMAHESYLSGSSSSYMDEMYEAWMRDPKSVHPSWDAYFKGVYYTAPPSLGMTRCRLDELSVSSESLSDKFSIAGLWPKVSKKFRQCWRKFLDSFAQRSCNSHYYLYHSIFK